jgi:hypothetical protein
MSILKLLAAIVNLTRAGGLKNINQVYGIAKRELGDKFNAAKKQIDMAFKEGQKQKKLDDRTKDIKKIDESVVAEGIETLADTKSGKSIMDQIQKSKTKIEDASSKITNAQKEIDEMYRPKTDEEIAEKFNKESDLMKRLEDKVKNIAKVENISTGLTRTITREILGKKGIELPKGTDAIELFKQKFGQDILIDINDLAEELIEMDRRGITPKPLTNLIEDAGLFDIKMPKEPPQGYTPDELADIQKEIDQEDILLKFDPTGRKSNSMGGINRIGFADGPKDPKKKTLIDTIKKIPKVGKIVGGAVEIINYVKTLDPIAAMKEVNNVIARKGPYKNVSDKDSQKIFDDTQDHIFGREPKPTEFDIIDDIDEVESTRALAPKMVERLEIKTKYPGIDDELVDKILIDDNPQRKAELLATLDEAFRMMEKGKGTDEIIDTFKNQNRTKQASGTGPEGLSEIVSLYKKINEKNKLKNEEKKSDQQVRYRKLIQSNQFPELNKFFKSKLKESNLNLEPRVNVSIGGPLRIDENKRRQQSYVDFLGRRGTGIGGTGTTTGGTYGSFSNSTPATGGSQPGTGSPGTGGTGITPPATGGGTGGTSGGSGVIPGNNNFQPNTGVTGGNTGTGNPFYGKGSGGGSKVFFQPSGGSSSGGGKTSAGFSFSKKEDYDKEIFADTDPANYYKESIRSRLTNSNPFSTSFGAMSPNAFLTNSQQAKARADGTFDDMWKFYEENKSLISEAERKNKSLRNLTADEYIKQFEDQSKNYGQTADDMAMYDQYGDIQNLNPEFYNEDGSLKMVLGEDGKYITARKAAGLEEGVRDKKDFLGAIEYLGYDDEELENLKNPFLSQEEKEANYEKKLDELEKEGTGNYRFIKGSRGEDRYSMTPEEYKLLSEEYKAANEGGALSLAIGKTVAQGFEDFKKEKFGTSNTTFTSDEHIQNMRERYRQKLAESSGLEKPGEDSRTDFYDKVSSEYAGGGADQSVLNLEKLAQSNEIKNLQKEIGFENLSERTSKEQKKSFIRSISDFASKYKVPLTVVAGLVGGPGGAQLAKQVLGANDMARMGVDVVGDVRKGDLKGAAETVAGAVIGKNTVDNVKEGTRVVKEKDIKGGVALGTDIALGKGAGNVVRKVLGAEGNQTNEQTAQTNEQTVPKQENQKVAKREPEPEYDGNIGSIFSDGGRVNKALGGPIDLAARKKQSQLDFLARQPDAQLPQAQPPAVNPQPPAVNPQPPAVNPQPPAAPQPFDMSKYQGGTFSGGIEDSRNIALDQLAGMGVDTSKYAKMTATDTSGPKFQGLSMNEIFAMDEQTARDTLGFDPSDPDASPEFEEFLRVNDPGPMAIGPGGPPGMQTEFLNQDELSQILNRAIPNYMQKAQEIGEDYTLDEMLAMSDDELAMIEDRYDKKMGYGTYAKRPGNTQTGYDPDAMQQYNDMQNFMGEVERQSKAAQGAPGNTLNYSTGGRVGFSSGSERKRIDRNMQTDYSNPFNNLAKVNLSREKAFTNALFKRNKKLVADEKKRKKNLTILNEDARAKALQRLNLLKRLYASGKR